MSKTPMVSSVNIRHVKRESLAYRVAGQSRRPLGSRMMFETQEELRSSPSGALLKESCDKTEWFTLTDTRPQHLFRLAPR
jgi:hypothetical protein